jgi:hypothetical protein
MAGATRFEPQHNGKACDKIGGWHVNSTAIRRPNPLCLGLQQWRVFLARFVSGDLGVYGGKMDSNGVGEAARCTCLSFNPVRFFTPATRDKAM